MNIVFRVDASQWIGVGHLSRCITLAKKLRKQHTVIFITEEGLAEQLIEVEGFHYFTIPQKKLDDSIQTVDQYLYALKEHCEGDVIETIKHIGKVGEVDWLIVDSYALSHFWQKQLRPYVNRIMVIDDLANREHDCDMLLDQNHYKHFNNRYHSLVPNHCKQLLGPNYMLLRDEFIQLRASNQQIRNQLRNVLVFYGGSDPTNETKKVLTAIKQLQVKNVHFHIVVGKLNPQKEEIKQMCSELEIVTYYEQIDYMATLMQEVDLAIGAGGSTTWERCLLGLPAVVTILADNQKQGIQELEELGFLQNIGWYENVTSQLLLETINDYCSNPNKLELMSKAAYHFFDVHADFTDGVVKEIVK